jgi:hypothetical protein
MVRKPRPSASLANQGSSPKALYTPANPAAQGMALGPQMVQVTKTIASVSLVLAGHPVHSACQAHSGALLLPGPERFSCCRQEVAVPEPKHYQHMHRQAVSPGLSSLQNGVMLCALSAEVLPQLPACVVCNMLCAAPVQSWREPCPLLSHLCVPWVALSNIWRKLSWTNLCVCNVCTTVCSPGGSLAPCCFTCVLKGGTAV